jgi:hypothetical protein
MIKPDWMGIEGSTWDGRLSQGVSCPIICGFSYRTIYYNRMPAVCQCLYEPARAKFICGF